MLVSVINDPSFAMFTRSCMSAWMTAAFYGLLSASGLLASAVPLIPTKRASIEPKRPALPLTPLHVTGGGNVKVPVQTCTKPNTKPNFSGMGPIWRDEFLFWPRWDPSRPESHLFRVSAERNAGLEWVGKATEGYMNG